ncbi:replication-relaxation family protein [Streptomyces sp. NPDC005349]|uniref:replication-relaxation family protein n=1 Tax=Streptomyces sp. NPDC005349 TaxID=3157037 RepID=UPI0033AEBD92
MSGRRVTNASGSSNALRGDVLRALGVLKMATADQIQRLSSPHLTYRHTAKKTPAQRKEARTASHRAAANDLRRHGLSADGGRTRAGEEVRLLTAAGLAAAAVELGRAPEEMGGLPKGAGRTGAAHAMTVNETVLALIRPQPDLSLIEGEPDEVLAAARTAAEAPSGIGTITSYATEVALPVSGTWKSPGLGSARADAVVTAPEHGMPLLFIEADNCHEDAVTIAAKFDRYARFYQRTAKDNGGGARLWSTRWNYDADPYRDPLPPILLVFNEIGARSAHTQIRNIAALTRPHWEGQPDNEGAFHSYRGKIPIVATRLDLLREHGPHGPVFWRFGRKHREDLWSAVGNPREDTTLRQRAQAHKERQAQEKRQQAREAAQREARRPSCTRCGQKLTDERWHMTETFPEPDRNWRPGMCASCEADALHQEKEQQRAEAEERQRQEAEANRPRGLFRRR